MRPAVLVVDDEPMNRALIRGTIGGFCEVLEAGAFDLLTEPYSERAVLSVVEHAFASRDARATRSVA